mmetsp:Transcript_36665/g.121467  ORF Transcript_36665/g.121467 Transcript_36665/m.121467 type:complete len:288 (+) Transcript_36665:2043-2906(+)
MVGAHFDVVVPLADGDADLVGVRLIGQGRDLLDPVLLLGRPAAAPARKAEQRLRVLRVVEDELVKDGSKQRVGVIQLGRLRTDADRAMVVAGEVGLLVEAEASLFHKVLRGSGPGEHLGKGTVRERARDEGGPLARLNAGVAAGSVQLIGAVATIWAPVALAVAIPGRLPWGELARPLEQPQVRRPASHRYALVELRVRPEPSLGHWPPVRREAHYLRGRCPLRHKDVLRHSHHRVAVKSGGGSGVHRAGQVAGVGMVRKVAVLESPVPRCCEGQQADEEREPHSRS